MGYYDKGNKYGKGIQLYCNGKVQAQGIWIANNKMHKSLPITSFLLNIDMKSLESENIKPIIVDEEAHEQTQEERDEHER